MEHPTRLETPAVIGSFWKRIFAMIADTLLLGAIGWLATFQFADRLIAFGPNGRAIGLGVSLLYFGILNSSVGGGATPGKRLFGLRVVKRSGARVSLIRSVWRAIVYLVPIFLNGWFFALPPLAPWQEIAFSTVDSTIVFGMELAMIYLYIANVSTRQTLHDLVAGTFVVKADSMGAPVANRTHSVHLVVVSVWLLLFLAGIPLAWPMLKNFATSNPLGIDIKGQTAVYQTVTAQPGVLSAQVNTNTFTSWSSGGKSETTTSLDVSANLDHAVTQEESRTAADAIARRVLAVKPDILGQQELGVTVRYGYDIGVWSQWQAYNYVDTPANWKSGKATRPSKKAK